MKSNWRRISAVCRIQDPAYPFGENERQRHTRRAAGYEAAGCIRLKNERCLMEQTCDANPP